MGFWKSIFTDSGAGQTEHLVEVDSGFVPVADNSAPDGVGFAKVLSTYGVVVQPTYSMPMTVHHKLGTRFPLCQLRLNVGGAWYNLTTVPDIWTVVDEDTIVIDFGATYAPYVVCPLEITLIG